MLDWFQHNPTDIYLLRVGYGGNSGPLSNVDQEGFASASFHSFPDTLAWDAYSGDYGPNFSGLIMGSGVYVVTTDALGTVAFGGNINVSPDNSIQVSPRDAVRRMVYLAQYGLRITVDAGAIELLSVDMNTKNLTVSIAEKVSTISTTAVASSAILRVEKVVQVGGTGDIVMVTNLTQARGGWNVTLGSGTVGVEVSF